MEMDQMVSFLSISNSEPPFYFTDKPFPAIFLFCLCAIWKHPDFSQPCYRESLKCGEAPEKQLSQSLLSQVF